MLAIARSQAALAARASGEPDHARLANQINSALK
jgi:hypothetical protein